MHRYATIAARRFGEASSFLGQVVAGEQVGLQEFYHVSSLTALKLGRTSNARYNTQRLLLHRCRLSTSLSPLQSTAFDTRSPR